MKRRNVRNRGSRTIVEAQRTSGGDNRSNDSMGGRQGEQSPATDGHLIRRRSSSSVHSNHGFEELQERDVAQIGTDDAAIALHAQQVSPRASICKPHEEEERLVADEEDCEEEEVPDRCAGAFFSKDALTKLTIHQLKPLLKLAGLGTSGRKKELVDRLANIRDTKAQQDGASESATSTDEGSVSQRRRRVSSMKTAHVVTPSHVNGESEKRLGTVLSRTDVVSSTEEEGAQADEQLYAAASLDSSDLCLLVNYYQSTIGKLTKLLAEESRRVEDARITMRRALEKQRESLQQQAVARGVPAGQAGADDLLREYRTLVMSTREEMSLREQKYEGEKKSLCDRFQGEIRSLQVALESADVRARRAQVAASTLLAEVALLRHENKNLRVAQGFITAPQALCVDA